MLWYYETKDTISEIQSNDRTECKHIHSHSHSHSYIPKHIARKTTNGTEKRQSFANENMLCGWFLFSTLLEVFFSSFLFSFSYLFYNLNVCVCVWLSLSSSLFRLCFVYKICMIMQSKSWSIENFRSFSTKLCWVYIRIVFLLKKKKTSIKSS